jgi:hypothetical protein
LKPPYITLREAAELLLNIHTETDTGGIVRVREKVDIGDMASPDRARYALAWLAIAEAVRNKVV